jgi:GAF domain-containing protein
VGDRDRKGQGRLDVAAREQRVIETFVELADTLVGDFDADELLHVLAERCVELLDVDAAGVMLAMQPGQLQAVAATSRDMHQLEIFEVAAAEGPSHAAYVAGAPVVEHDLRTVRARWPEFAKRALDLGFVAAHGFPLRLRERTVGALNLFQSERRVRLGDADVLVAQGFADVAAISLIQAELAGHSLTTVAQLEHALSARLVTEQAKGILAERLALTPQQVFERLRRHARDHNRKVHDVAGDVVEGRLDGL